VDLNGIRQANVCGLGQEVNQHTMRDGKQVWLTGHSGGSASYLQESMALLRTDPAYYARVISHIVPYRAAPRIFAHLLADDQRNVAGEPCVKAIIDFTSEDEQITVFHPDQLSARLAAEPIETRNAG
jgi:hypothetical protein